MRIFQGVQYLQNHRRGSLWPKPTGYLQQSVEPRTIDIFHRDKRYLVVFGEIEGRRYVWVKKSAAGARSTSETVAPSLPSGALRQFAPQDLDRHGPVQNRVITAKDNAHRTRGEPLVNAVTANGENRVHLVTCELPGGSPLHFEHLQRFLQTSPHPVEGSGQGADLVSAAADQLGGVELSQADFACHVGYFFDRFHDNKAQQQVDDDDHHNERPDQRGDKQQECTVGARERHSERDRDDLGADDFSELPAKPVLRAVKRGHCRRRFLRRAMADEATLAADL